MSALLRHACLGVLMLSACKPQVNFTSFQQNLQSFGRKSEYQIYLGNLHSHTAYSDGILNPREAYRTAQGNGLDFMAITEHNHSAAGGDDKIYLTPQLYNDLKKTAQEMSVAGKFAALYGQEFSTISSGNHVNIFNAKEIVNVPNGDFKQLYEKWLPTHPEVAFVQFNHPNYRQDLGLAPVNDVNNTLRASADHADHDHHAEESRLDAMSIQKGNTFNDYGYDDYNRNFAGLAQAANPWVRTIEILNGPGTSPKPIGKAEARNEEDYFFYLNEGFKIAPSADQDNHFAHWGSLHTGRTGVVAKTLTPEGIYEGLRARRVFASEDSNLKVSFQANGAWMGSELPPAPEVNIVINLEDPDEPQATYLLQIFADQVGKSVAKPIVQKQIPAGQKQLQLKWTPEGNGLNYAFVKVTQLNADGSQDDLWTAPVWMMPAR